MTAERNRRGFQDLLSRRKHRSNQVPEKHHRGILNLNTFEEKGLLRFQPALRLSKDDSRRKLGEACSARSAPPASPLNFGDVIAFDIGCGRLSDRSDDRL